MSNPNSWATATVKNNWGSPISMVTLKHRYDTDHYDKKSWGKLDDGEIGESFNVGFWTGPFRIGKDYWQIVFEADGVLWTCKDNFYCFLKASDVKGKVICRVYKDGNEGKMEVICPKSSRCIVSLTSDVVTPNSFATVIIKNDTARTISHVQLNHRYDYDHYDVGDYTAIEKGMSSLPFNVGFWTGSGRTGKDYWLINFISGSTQWTSKDNFYCFLTKDDVNGQVVCEVFEKDGGYYMNIIPPVSGKATVKLSSRPIPASDNRPVYLIGHRANSPGYVSLAISKGCNAVECDLQYNHKTRQIYVNHDINSGPHISSWLNHAKKTMSLYKDDFALIVFDCKFAGDYEPSISSMAMVELRNLVRKFLNNGEPSAVNVVFSIAHYNDRNVFNDIMKDLLPNEIISIDMHDIPEDVDAFYANNAINNGWYGDGIFVAGTKDVYPYIKRACKLRDENKTLKKIYVWTLAKESSIKKYIDDAHVDGVFINVPGFVPDSITGVQEALHVISNSTEARMAKRSDSIKKDNQLNTALLQSFTEDNFTSIYWVFMRLKHQYIVAGHFIFYKN